MARQSLKAYLDQAFAGFVSDKPDSRFQKGYLAALLEIARVFETSTADEIARLERATGRAAELETYELSKGEPAMVCAGLMLYITALTELRRQNVTELDPLILTANELRQKFRNGHAAYIELDE